MKRFSMSNTVVFLQKNRAEYYLTAILVPVLVLVCLCSLTMGRYAISLSDIFSVFYTKIFAVDLAIPANVETVLFKVRIPRIIAAVLVGASLSVSGASYQGLFRNPMVSPDILGASAGAGFGAALGILLSFGTVGIQLYSFLFGLGAVALAVVVSSAITRGNNVTLVLVLTGMVVSTLFSSFVSLIKYVADPYSKLPAITFWLMGSLSTASMKDVKMMLFPFLLGVVPLMLLRWKLNVLSFGEEEAKTMGVETAKLRLVVIICSTLLTAGSVSVCGIIGWIGLVIPHFARMLAGPNYKILLPVSLLFGSIFLIIVDTVARSAFPLEIPLGILTSLVGAPFFIYLLFKGKRGWL